MNLSRNDLYRIIIEEYLKEEGLTEAPGDVLDLLRRIKDDPDYDPREDPGAHTYARGEEEEEEAGDSTRTMSRPHRKEPEDKDKGETFTMDIQAAPTPASESPVETIVALLQGVEHNDAVDILTLAAEALGLAPPEDAGPSTAYGGEELDLRQKQGQRIGFEEGLDLEGLMGLIREVLGEERDLGFDEWMDTMLTRLTDHYGQNIDHEDMLPQPIAHYQNLHAQGACPHATADQVALDY